ncbi:MAG: GGDEF domain-containing protein [Planctomycetota bacterium]
MPTSSNQPSRIGNMLDKARRHPKVTLCVSLVVASIIAPIDHWAGDEIPLLVLYLPSIIMVCWAVSLRAGAMLATIASVGWILDDAIVLSEDPAAGSRLWLAAVHACFFTVILGMVQRLRMAHDHEHRLARTDGLTGLCNAKAFREAAESVLTQRRQPDTNITLAFIDCDNFKTVNDTLGHLEGDRLLAAISEQMKSSVRKQDVPARMGGDEFAILMPDTTQEEARQVIGRVCEALNARMQASNWPVTFSVGVAVYATPPESVDALIHGADELMYQVKDGQKDATIYQLVA